MGQTPFSIEPVILAADGTDITGWITKAAEDFAVPLDGLLALLIAEGGLNPKAERWGKFTPEAKGFIAESDYISLQHLINEAWPDISFGMSQRIVLYHDQGNRRATVENCLVVRDYVFSHPEEDIRAAASRFKGCMDAANGNGLTGDDLLIGGMVVYNHGSYPPPTDDYWTKWAGNVIAYRQALIQARGMLQT